MPDFIPAPHIILMGCQPNLMPHRATPCPVCKGIIGHRPGPVAAALDKITYCAQCDASAPAVDATIRGAKLGLKARERAEDAERKAVKELDRVGRRATLTETERRRLWNGYRGGVLSPTPDVTDRAKIGRDWLTREGMEPDWDLILDGKGRVVGRRVDAEAPAA